MKHTPLVVKISFCVILSVVIIAVASNRQHLLALINHEEEEIPVETCADVLTGPASRTDWPQWLPFAEQLAKEVKTADEAEGYDVLFYGDSITEQWRGSGVGSIYPSLQEIPIIFNERFNQNYSSHVLAIAGDQVGHLWWRIMNGELPVRKHPKAVVILIGTNDMTADDCTQSEPASIIAARELSSRTQSVVELLSQKLPSTQIVLLGLLPRDAHVLSGPPVYEWPNRMTRALELVNLEYKGLAENTNNAHFLDCSAPFLKAGGGLKREIIPDALHPNTQGMDLLGACIQPVLDELIMNMSN